MIEVNKVLEIKSEINNVLKYLPYNISDALIFDIETTGFSAHSSQLYLIGVTYYKDDSWRLIQWLAETRSDELIIIEKFFEFTKEFHHIVHFNGDNFDVPYIQKKCTIHDLNYSFDGLDSIDLYKYFKNFKNFLPLEKFSLKAIEKHLGITRRDLYSGGELIQNYFNFTSTGNKEDFDKLILHNEDDLIGTVKLLPTSLLGKILSKDKLEVTSVVINEDFINIKLNTYLPLPCSIHFNDLLINLIGYSNSTEIDIKIKVFKGVLKHFFDNYKEYYYLPLEDQAIHKSVAQFVDSQHKKKANKNNCYIKLNSTFLPQRTNLIAPYFYKEINDKISYFEPIEGFYYNKLEILKYLCDLLNIKL
ncbi:MAG: polymerase exonuclease [Clostridiales bacterium]|jgi:uncharacterized protein YprB with RNaseH-like and TPR domain|nr:polymerase exonuclease [Clostridiales bacterium]